MNPIVAVDVSQFSVDISREFEMVLQQRKPGPPKRVDGYTLGIIRMESDAPHGGEIHPDGDEFLFVISGKLRVASDSRPGEDLELGPGDGCIVKQNHWHKVSVVEPAMLLHLTPGPNGDHRPIGYGDTA